MGEGARSRRMQRVLDGRLRVEVNQRRYGSTSPSRAQSGMPSPGYRGEGGSRRSECTEFGGVVRVPTKRST
jgi:hypothetical protein